MARLLLPLLLLLLLLIYCWQWQLRWPAFPVGRAFRAGPQAVAQKVCHSTVQGPALTVQVGLLLVLQAPVEAVLQKSQSQGQQVNLGRPSLHGNNNPAGTAASCNLRL